MRVLVAARTAMALVPLSLLADTARVCHAQEEESRRVTEGSSTDQGDYLINRRHTVAELEAGIIALPNAPIRGHKGGDTPFGTIGKGDATLQTGLHLLYRGGRDWSIGAGALFGPRPTSDDEYGGASGLSRTHARSYLQLGTEGRYIPLHLKTFEGWVGLTLGAIVVADRYVTNSGDAVPQVLGTKEVTVRTEGLSFGVQGGFDWMFAERLVAGLALRLDKWLLPTDARCAAIAGDCATLSGPVEAFEVGLKIGYRLPL